VRRIISRGSLILALALIVATYEMFRFTDLLNPLLTPSIKDILRALIGLITQPYFLKDIFISGTRTLVGVALGTIAGVPLGMLMGIVIGIRRGILPLIDFFRSLPAAALFPALSTLLGIGEGMKLMAIAFPSGLLMATAVYYACIEVNSRLIEYAQLRGFTSMQLFKNVYFPSVLLRLPEGLQYTLPLGLVLSVVADMFIGANNGLGLRLIEFQETFSLDKLYATILVTGFVGYALSNITAALIRRTRKYSI
jgi:NitT/TauT family transport system permease protein